MVINLEAVGQKTTGPLPEGFTPTGWSSNTLNELRQYTSASDMHQIGLMIDEQLQGVVEPSEEALNFLDQLKHKKLSAVGAWSMLGSGDICLCARLHNQCGGHCV